MLVKKILHYHQDILMVSDEDISILEFVFVVTEGVPDVLWVVLSVSEEVLEVL